MHLRFFKVLLSVFFLANTAAALEVGSQLPAFTLSDRNGKQIELSSFKGKVVLVDFWASWCGSCKRSLPWLNTLQETYGKDGFQVVAINVDSNPAKAQALLRTVQESVVVALDPEGNSAERFNVSSMPSSFLIGRDGTVRSVQRGFSNEEQSAIEKGLERELSAGRGGAQKSAKTDCAKET